MAVHAPGTHSEFSEVKSFSNWMYIFPGEKLLHFSQINRTYSWVTQTFRWLMDNAVAKLKSRYLCIAWEISSICSCSFNRIVSMDWAVSFAPNWTVLFVKAADTNWVVDPVSGWECARNTQTGYWLLVLTPCRLRMHTPIPINWVVLSPPAQQQLVLASPTQTAFETGCESVHE